MKTDYHSTISNKFDRVRAHTSPEILARIDREIDDRIREYANRSPSEISERIEALEQEWDIERVLEVNGSCLGLTGLLLGATVDRRWLVLTGGVLGFCLQHALQGWCPPIHFFRQKGVRTQGEIDREKYALKALRGDFEPSSEEVKNDRNARAGEIAWAVRA